MLSIGGPLQENDKNKAHDFSEERDELADALEKCFHQVRESVIAYENGFMSTGPLGVDKHGMGKTALYGLNLYTVSQELLYLLRPILLRQKMKPAIWLFAWRRGCVWK